MINFRKKGKSNGNFVKDGNDTIYKESWFMEIFKRLNFVYTMTKLEILKSKRFTIYFKILEYEYYSVKKARFRLDTKKGHYWEHCEITEKKFEFSSC